ncbi:MAG TPA: hypothetical protein VFM54_12355 [Micromonosporaceae bacterium]|nr:hypothetical protein [Micromonosporaceae bacterium]
MRRRPLQALVVVAAVLTSALATAAVAEAKASTTVGVVTSGTAVLSPDVARTVKGTGADAHQAALKRYWTPERMRAARPDSDLPAMRTAAAAERAAQAPTKPQGPPVQVAPGAPDAEPTAEPTTVQPMSYYPGYPVGHPVARTYGKVFFTLLGGNYVCSGTIVNTEGKSVVWTAGHCLTGSQQWATNWTFVPNYGSGSAPYGHWYAYQLWTTTAWFYNNNDFANDVGAAVMYRNGGWRITDYLGGQGIAWNYGTDHYMYAFGYPQGYPFDGCCLVADEGPTYDGGGGTIYMVNYMTGGSSGGAWLNWFDGSWGYINGHNDFKYTSLPQYMFSPYYGDQVGSVYEAVRHIST